MLRANPRQKMALFMILLQVPVQAINVGLTGYTVTGETMSDKGPVSTGAEYTGVILALLTLITLSCDLADRYILGQAEESEAECQHLKEIIIQARRYYNHIE